MSLLLERAYNPDVLSCLANLSNDEVFTPPEIANQMLDLLPEEIWHDTSVKVLDPACKTGVFLREAAKRFINAQIPNYQEIARGVNEKRRRGEELSQADLYFEHDLEAVTEHVFRHQLFGIAITELTSLMTRRGLYCSKYPNSKYSIVPFDNAEGNVRFKTKQHTWVADKCSYCGAPKTLFEREDGLETHAYEFIHVGNPEEITDMKFDVIIGNPPYQLDDGGNGVSATPIFQYFVEQAKKLNPHYLTMIIPARWYAGGKGLNDFRETMLHDKRIRRLVDYESSKDCFEGVNIAGGVCYFLWDRDYSGLCEVTNYSINEAMTAQRDLAEYPILIRSNFAQRIVNKINGQSEAFVNEYACARNPFGFSTNYRGRTTKKNGDIEILTSKGIQYVARDDVKKNVNLIDSFKVLTGRLVPSNGELDLKPGDTYKVIPNTRIINPGQINTETYLDIGVFDTLEEAKNFELYLCSKFVRFLLRQAISSLNITRDSFRFVPMLDFSESYTDAQLFEMFGLSDEEADYIERIMRPMEPSVNNG